MRKKLGWTVKGILGAVFTLIGLVFVPLSLILGRLGPVSRRGTGDPAVFRAVFGGVGALFLIPGLILLGMDLRRRHLLRRAYDGGYCVDARILGVSAQRNVTVGGRHPLVVECAHTDSSGVVHVYRSRYLYSDVTNLLKSGTVPVYIDRMDDSVGFVDIDAVLPEIRIH